MSASTANSDTFASGRYSKRKRAPVTYALDESADSDIEFDLESPTLKVECRHDIVGTEINKF